MSDYCCSAGHSDRRRTSRPVGRGSRHPRLSVSACREPVLTPLPDAAGTAVVGQSAVVLAHDGSVDLVGFRRGVAEAGNETRGVEHAAVTHMVCPLADSVHPGRDVLLAADQCLTIRACREHPDIGKALALHKSLKCLRKVIRRCYGLGPCTRDHEEERRGTVLFTAIYSGLPIDHVSRELGAWRHCADLFIGPSITDAIAAFEDFQARMNTRYDKLLANGARKITPRIRRERLPDPH